MPDAMLAGLPRMVRVAGEIRWRGQASVAVAAAVSCYWLARWLLDEPVRPLETLVSAGAVGLITALLTMVTSVNRVREGLRETLPPPRLALYETHADARERRTRLAGVVLLAVVVLLLFDRATNGDGVMAGLMVGLFAVAGTVDLFEARRWREGEAARRARLYVMVRPNAMVASFGRTEIYEVPRPDPDRRIEPARRHPGVLD